MYKEQDMTDVKQLPEAFLKEMEQLLGDEYEGRSAAREFHR